MNGHERFALFAALVGLAATEAVASGWLTLGPPGFRMVIPRAELDAPVALWPLVLGTACAAAVVGLVAARRQMRGALLAVALVIATMGLDLGLHQPIPAAWSWRTIATITLNPFFAEASRQQSPVEAVAAQRARLEAGCGAEAGDRRRLATYPAGLPVMYGLVWRFTSRGGPLTTVLARLGEPDPVLTRDLPVMQSQATLAAATAANLIHLLAVALLPLAAWWLAHELFGHEAGVVAASLTALAPAAHLWVNDPNVLTAAVPAAAAAMLLVAARTRPWVALPVGVAVAVAGGLTLAVVPGIAVAGLLLLVAGNAPLARRLATAAWCVGGAALATAAAGAITGSSPLVAAMLAIRNNRQFYALVDRSYWPTPVTNMAEMWVLAGAVTTTAAVLAGSRAVIGGDHVSGRRKAALRAVVVVLAVVAAVLWSGAVRGEIGRLGVGLMPLLAVAAASDEHARGRSATILVAAAALACVLLCSAVEPVLGAFMS